MKRWTRFLGIMMAAVLFGMASLPGIARAKEIAPPVNLKAAAEKVQPYVTRLTDGTFVLDTKRAGQVVPPEVLTTLQASMTYVNTQIRAGNLVSHEDLTVTFPETGASFVGTGDVILAGTGGVDGFQIYWWGFELYFSATMCLILGMIAGGANVATNFLQAILSRIPNLPGVILSVLMPVVRGLLGFSVMFWGYYAARDGVVMAYAWPAIPIGWWGQ